LGGKNSEWQMESTADKIKFTEFIRSTSLNLGFDKVGFSKAGSIGENGRNLKIWLEKGYQGTMNWMEERSKERTDIRNYFPGAKSVVSLAINYFHGEAKGEMKLSNYAWGDDYHKVIKNKLFELLSETKNQWPEIHGVVCVDTSPVMEKVWAQKSGIGWIGKHTNLITRDLGSWVFLGELILDCDLDYDSTFEEDLCGSCTACIDACPTDAIVDDYLLDANKCISYLTIEHRGNLPEEMEDQLNGWIYGCDICQEVCPWNIKFGKISKEKSFAPREKISNMKRDDWALFTKDDYIELFKNSAVKRAKYRGLKRNIQLNTDTEFPKS